MLYLCSFKPSKYLRYVHFCTWSPTRCWRFPPGRAAKKLDFHLGDTGGGPAYYSLLIEFGSYHSNWQIPTMLVRQSNWAPLLPAPHYGTVEQRGHTRQGCSWHIINVLLSGLQHILDIIIWFEAEGLCTHPQDIQASDHSQSQDDIGDTIVPRTLGLYQPSYSVSYIQSILI